ncbi:aromatic acid exporter family protein [Streptomyces sp. NPDC046805]|uniref:FUSC family protein n=1 Tax=Streptomyces sp. NPDC046805 TaxID=3155134 RepID=UPI00340AD265
MSSGRYRAHVPGPGGGPGQAAQEPVVVRTPVDRRRGLWLSGNAQPLLAPLTALLVVQVTLYATLTLGIRRIASVVAGVLIAVGFTDAVGLTWWSLGLLVLVCLPLGHLLHLAPWGEEVAVTDMLVFGMGGQRTEALGRVIETLIGVTVGVLLNPVVAPPVYVGPSGEATRDLAARLLLLRIGDELVHGASARHVTAWLEEARRLDHQTADVDAALARAEESLRLDPRGRPAPGTRLVLRSGLNAMEHCAVGLRSLCRPFADLRLMNRLDIDRRLRVSHTEDRPGARRRRDGSTLGGLLRSLRSGELRGWWGGRVDRAGAGRSAAPDNEEHIASWEEQCGTGH